jgi:hypothetical protein
MFKLLFRRKAAAVDDGSQSIRRAFTPDEFGNRLITDVHLCLIEEVPTVQRDSWVFVRNV